MTNKLKDIVSNFDKRSLILLKKGLKLCFALLIFSSLILFTYTFFNTTPSLFNIGILLFKTSINFSIEFIICSLAIDTIKKGR